ncbi:hypothetical protein Tco_0845224 [Tanacetum coccineum]
MNVEIPSNLSTLLSSTTTFSLRLAASATYFTSSFRPLLTSTTKMAPSCLNKASTKCVFPCFWDPRTTTLRIRFGGDDVVPVLVEMMLYRCVLTRLQPSVVFPMLLDPGQTNIAEQCLNKASTKCVFPCFWDPRTTTLRIRCWWKMMLFRIVGGDDVVPVCLNKASTKCVFPCFWDPRTTTLRIRFGGDDVVPVLVEMMLYRCVLTRLQPSMFFHASGIQGQQHCGCGDDVVLVVVEDVVLKKTSPKELNEARLILRLLDHTSGIQGQQHCGIGWWSDGCTGVGGDDVVPVVVEDVCLNKASTKCVFPCFWDPRTTTLRIRFGGDDVVPVLVEMMLYRCVLTRLQPSVVFPMLLDPGQTNIAEQCLNKASTKCVFPCFWDPRTTTLRIRCWWKMMLFRIVGGDDVVPVCLNKASTKYVFPCFWDPRTTTLRIRFGGDDVVPVVVEDVCLNKASTKFGGDDVVLVAGRGCGIVKEKP